VRAKGGTETVEVEEACEGGGEQDVWESVGNCYPRRHWFAYTFVALTCRLFYIMFLILFATFHISNHFHWLSVFHILSLYIFLPFAFSFLYEYTYSWIYHEWRRSVTLVFSSASKHEDLYLDILAA